MFAAHETCPKDALRSEARVLRLTHRRLDPTVVCMPTTVDVDDKLLEAARRRAAEEGTTLTAFVEHALATALTSHAPGRDDYKLHWKTHRGRLLPGVDIADRDSLFDAVDERR